MEIVIYKAKKYLGILLLMVLAISVIYPLAWTVVSSIREPTDFFKTLGDSQTNLILVYMGKSGQSLM